LNQARDLIAELAFVAHLNSESDCEFARRIAAACAELVEMRPDREAAAMIRTAFDL